MSQLGSIELGREFTPTQRGPNIDGFIRFIERGHRGPKVYVYEAIAGRFTTPDNFLDPTLANVVSAIEEAAIRIARISELRVVPAPEYRYPYNSDIRRPEITDRSVGVEVISTQFARVKNEYAFSWALRENLTELVSYFKSDKDRILFNRTISAAIVRPDKLEERSGQGFIERRWNWRADLPPNLAMRANIEDVLTDKGSRRFLYMMQDNVFMDPHSHSGRDFDNPDPLCGIEVGYGSLPKDKKVLFGNRLIQSLESLTKGRPLPGLSRISESDREEITANLLRTAAFLPVPGLLDILKKIQQANLFLPGQQASYRDPHIELLEEAIVLHTNWYARRAPASISHQGGIKTDPL